MRFLNKVLEADEGQAAGFHGVLEQLGQDDEELLVNKREEGTKGFLHSLELINAKIRIHHALIDELNLVQIERFTRDELRAAVYGPVQNHVVAERLPLNSEELSAFIDEVIDELIGLGPIEPLLKDPTITDILINSHERVYVERGGRLEPVGVRFRDEAHLLRIVNKVVGAVGRRVDEFQPMVDARLADGSRVNVAVRPIAVDGPLISIRKFARDALDLQALINAGALSTEMAILLSEAVNARLSVVVSGGTGSGKTTLLNAMSQYIPANERLITIEDAAELQLQQPHVGRLETRPPNIEGDGEIRQRELVKNALRMRPDRIIVGEVRGEEAFDMLQAMSTGHEGSMTTIHANNPRDALTRLEQMINMAGFTMSEASMRSQIVSAIELVVQVQRFQDGKRRVTAISEVVGIDETIIQMQDLFRFEPQPVLEDGLSRGVFRATGLRPSFAEKMRLGGAQIDDRIFQPGGVD